MNVKKSFLALLAIAFVSLYLMPIASGASKASTDTGYLGNDQWIVQTDGDLVPAADSSCDIGESGSEVDNIYVDDIAITGLTGTSATLTGNLLFQSTIYASGHSSGASQIASTVSPLTSANIAFALVQFSNGRGGTTNLPDGVIGKTVTFEVLANPSVKFKDEATGSITKTGWTQIHIDDVGDRITLLWVDDTTGWIISSNDGCTITP